MDRKADLHCHSLYSDGSNRPVELVDLAVERGYWGLAITDHDSLEAFDEAAEYAAARSIVLFPGIEISAEFQEKSIHVLGYCFDPKAPALHEMCRKNRARRDERNRLMIERLAALGMPITMDEVKALFPHATTFVRPHIAGAMVRRGYVPDIVSLFL